MHLQNFSFGKYGSVPQFIVCGNKAKKVQTIRIKNYDDQTRIISYDKNDTIKELYDKYQQQLGDKQSIAFYFNHPKYQDVPIPLSTQIQKLLKNTNETILTVKKKESKSKSYQFTIQVSFAGNKTDFEVKNIYTIKELRNKLKEKFEISQNNQLQYQKNLLNDDEQTLEDLEITLNSSIQILRKKQNLQNHALQDIFLIAIIMPDSREIRFKVNQFDHVQSLKEKIYIAEKILIVQQLLMFDKEPLENKDILVKYRNKILSMTIKQSGGCFKFNTQVLISSDEGSKNEKYQAIEKLKKGDQILSYNCTSEKLEVEVISFVVHEQIKSGVKIIFDDNRTIECTPNHYFLTSDGKWQNCQYDRPDVEILHPGSQLQSIADKTQLIKDIQYFVSNEPVDFYHLYLDQNHTLVVNGLTIYKMQIFIQPINKQNFSIEIKPSDHIQDLKKYIQEKAHIQMDNQKWIAAGLQLKQFRFDNPIIQKCPTITVLDRSEIIISLSQNFSESYQNLFKEIKQIVFKISRDQFINIPYIDVRNMTTEQFIEKYTQNKSKSPRLIYGNIILSLKQKIKVIQNFQLQQIVEITMIYSGDKIVLSRMLKDKEVSEPTHIIQPDKEQLVKKIMKRIKQQNLPKFMISITYYSSSFQYFKKVNQQLRELTQNKINKGIQKNWKLDLCCGVINALEILSSFIGEVHRGVYDFKISSKFQKECICFSEFLSCSKKQSVALKFMENKGSLLHIKSITGKQIWEYSLYASQDQVLFPPYTYFFIDKIIDHGHYVEMWMTEMPSPSIFKKDIIVWVDDIPKNNQCYIQKLSNQFEVLSLMSTKITQIWLQQFWWVLNLNLKYKIISDMVRKQNGIDNYYAGIDLIELLYNKWKINPKILIFCGNPQKGKQNALDRKISQQKLFQITNSILQLSSFIGQNWKTDEIQAFTKMVNDKVSADKISRQQKQRQDKKTQCSLF